MTREHVDLSGDKQTLLITLYGKALDSRAAHPILGETIFALSRGALSLRGAYALALAAQSAFAALFFVGACRRYRGTYATTFNVPMGLALVAVWSVLSIVAIRNWDSYTVRVGFRFNSPGADRQAQNQARLGVMLASVLSAGAGMAALSSAGAARARREAVGAG